MHPMHAGRPTKLTPQIADGLVSAIANGATLDAAADAAGIAPRTIRGWRRRAFSRDPRDARFVAFERRLLMAFGQATARPKPDLWPVDLTAFDVDLDPVDVDVDAILGPP
jgi:hypothetical protein